MEYAGFWHAPRLREADHDWFPLTTNTIASFHWMVRKKSRDPRRQSVKDPKQPALGCGVAGKLDKAHAPSTKLHGT